MGAWVYEVAIQQINWVDPDSACTCDSLNPSGLQMPNFAGAEQSSVGWHVG